MVIITNLLDDLVGDMVKKLAEKKDKPTTLKAIKEGRTWEEIAMAFINEVRPIVEKYPKGFSLNGRDLRKIVGEPKNKTFKRKCMDHGVRVTKRINADIYKVEKYDIIAKELKKREDSGMFRPI